MSIKKILEYYGYLDYQTHGVGKKRFAIWSGDQSSSEKCNIKEIFNRKDNTFGEKIKIILGSPSIKEGITLKRVRQVHLLDPYWNMNRIRQIIGRAVRFCSHMDLDEEDRKVAIYLYLSVHPKLKNSIDQHILKMAINKDKINSHFEMALKEAAVDCSLFKNANDELKLSIKCDN